MFIALLGSIINSLFLRSLISLPFNITRSQTSKQIVCFIRWLKASSCFQGVVYLLIYYIFLLLLGLTKAGFINRGASFILLSPKSCSYIFSSLSIIVLDSLLAYIIIYIKRLYPFSLSNLYLLILIEFLKLTSLPFITLSLFLIIATYIIIPSSLLLKSTSLDRIILIKLTFSALPPPNLY